jgi:hypothetical protein
VRGGALSPAPRSLVDLLREDEARRQLAEGVSMIPTTVTGQRTEQTTERTAMRPFYFEIPEAELIELRRRIKATRWPDRDGQGRIAGGAARHDSGPRAVLGDRIRLAQGRRVHVRLTAALFDSKWNQPSATGEDSMSQHSSGDDRLAHELELALQDPVQRQPSQTT